MRYSFVEYSFVYKSGISSIHEVCGVFSIHVQGVFIHAVCVQEYMHEVWYFPCMRHSFVYKSVVFSYKRYMWYSFVYKSVVFSIHGVFICVQECGIFHYSFVYKSVVFSLHEVFICFQEVIPFSFVYKSVVFSIHSFVYKVFSIFMYKSVVFSCIHLCTRGIFHLCTRVCHARGIFVYMSVVFSIHEVFICVQECGIFHA